MADEETARSRLFALPSVSPHKVSGAAPTDLGFEGLGSGLAVCGFGDSCSGSNSKTSVSFGGAVYYADKKEGFLHQYFRTL